MSTDFPIMGEPGENDSNEQVVRETPLLGQNSSVSDASQTYGIGELRDRLRQPCKYEHQMQITNETVEMQTSSQKGNSQHGETPIRESPISIARDKVMRYNKRTPNLDKVAKFFLNNKSPNKDNLFKKLENSHLEDTPISQRNPIVSENATNEGRISSTEFVNLQNSERHTSFSQSNDSDMAIVVAPSNGSDHFQNDAAPSHQRSAKIFDQTHSEIIQDLPFKSTSSPLALKGNWRNMGHIRERKSLPNSGGTGTYPESYFGENIENQTAEKVQIDNDSATKGHSSVTSNENAIEMTQRIPMTEDDYASQPWVKNDVQNHDSGISPSFDIPHGEIIDARNNEISIANTRIDDTTAETISPRWVFRPLNGRIYSSNKSTQLIHVEDTQRPTSEPEIGREALESQGQLIANNATQQTQALSAHGSQARSSEDDFKTFEREKRSAAPTQIIKSQEQNSLSNLDTPPNATTILFEPIMEVPETSSPSKTDVNKIFDSSPSTCKDTRNLSSVHQENSQEKVHLQISSKNESPSVQECDSIQTSETKRDLGVVVSEAELTQDLPEVEDIGTQEIESANFERREMIDISDVPAISPQTSPKETRKKLVDRFDDGQYDVTPPKKRSCRNQQRSLSIKRLLENTPDESCNSRTPGSSSGTHHLDEHFADTTNNPYVEYPTEVLTEDVNFLSKTDIRFEDAVWCQYSLDYNYYPGRIDSTEESSENTWIYFDTGRSLTKNDDIYYLDIRVGDTVNLKSKKYTVVALECVSHDRETIRCIRGFDTVHLSKKNNSGIYGKKTLKKRLAEIHLDIKEWSKRPKIILESGSQTISKAHQDLRHPIRGRTNTLKLSPRKVKHFIGTPNRPIYREDSYSDHASSSGAVLSALPAQSIRTLSFDLPVDTERKQIFSGCAFALTGFSEDRDELHNIIRSFGGDVLDLGFSSLFEFERLQRGNGREEMQYFLNHVLKENSKYKNHRFACLITTQHTRSLKYLETLVLKWPTLHWKFIKECIKRGSLEVDLIHQYLLPSGESYRLSLDSKTGRGIVKSSNICQFYANLVAGKCLEHQVGAMKALMPDHTVIIYGCSAIDRFLRFVFSCLGVRTLYQIFDPGANPDLTFLLMARINELNDKANVNSKILVYLNQDKLSCITGLKKQISNAFLQDEYPFSVRLESKEWLIQTIINESTGFLEEEQA